MFKELAVRVQKLEIAQSSLGTARSHAGASIKLTHGQDGTKMLKPYDPNKVEIIICRYNLISTQGLSRDDGKIWLENLRNSLDAPTKDLINWEACNAINSRVLLNKIILKVHGSKPECDKVKESVEDALRTQE